MIDHPSMGLYPNSNDKRTILQAQKIPFEITHIEDGSRFCGYKKINDSTPKILLTGDSNMHGDGVNDSSHVGFLLQEKFEKFHVINKSVPGYGGVNQLLVLRETLKDYTPHIVIANYGKETDKMVSLLKNENIDYLYADISPELTFAPIDFHLNEEGNKKLAKQILDVLEK